MNDAPVYLAICRACGAHPAASVYVTEVPQPGPFYCPNCRAGLICAEEHAQPNTCVELVDGFAGREWVVLSRDGDALVVRPLGRPDAPSREVTTVMVKPKFSYQRLNSIPKRQRRTH